MTTRKVMGPALIATLLMLGMSSMMASAAFGASYKSGTSTTYVTGSNEGATHTFKAGAVPVTCTSLSGSGEFTSGATSLTLAVVTLGSVEKPCKVAGQNATVNFNGCDYKFGEPTGASSPYTIKTITIECPAGKEIVITAATAGCTIKIKAQATTGTTTATNNAGPPKTVTLAANVSGITYTSSGGICGAAGTFATGTTAASILIKGYTSAAHTTQTDIFVS